MAEDPIPADVREFIVRSIDSIAYLEALLLLRVDMGVKWTAQSVAARLYVKEAEAEGILARLAAEGYAVCEGTSFSYECAPEIDLLVERLGQSYARHLIPVTNLIHSRSGAIQAFASAFKLRKDR